MPGEIPDFEEVKLQETRKILIETAFVVNDMEIPPSLRNFLERIAHATASPQEWYGSDQLFRIAHFEIIEEGLSEYY